ncbi:hypothetical protein UFOVP452_28 [uncultured Caudovirales phage]|uniref:Uncharacterized protein n=1 Tax=uncultured Caudovirales phage TaxID=2100421 RepID=A0A6J5MG04_9CAUD|nr:hypothetical protein UFOVP452_28 [uncultured Caudovirales phage]
MTPGEVRAAYRTSIAMTGEPVTLRTFTGAGASRTPADATVRARVRGYAPAELVGGVTQGDRELIVLAEDVATAPKKGDQVIVRGRTLNVEAVDDSTRRFAGILMAYVLTARG